MITNRPWKPTRVQQDVIERLKAGWVIAHPPLFGPFMLRKDGEPAHHVYALTVRSLRDQGLIRKGGDYWVLS